MKISISESKRHLQDMIELLSEVEAKTFIPKRFRKLPIEEWWGREHFRYVRYLRKEVSNLEKRLFPAKPNASS